MLTGPLRPQLDGHNLYIVSGESKQGQKPRQLPVSQPVHGGDASGGIQQPECAATPAHLCIHEGPDLGRDRHGEAGNVMDNHVTRPARTARIGRHGCPTASGLPWLLRSLPGGSWAPIPTPSKPTEGSSALLGLKGIQKQVSKEVGLCPVQFRDRGPDLRHHLRASRLPECIPVVSVGADHARRSGKGHASPSPPEDLTGAFGSTASSLLQLRATEPDGRGGAPVRSVAHVNLAIADVDDGAGLVAGLGWPDSLDGENLLTP